MSMLFAKKSLISISLKLFFLTTATALSNLTSQSAKAGHSVGNGGDYLDYLNITAWAPNTAPYGLVSVRDPLWCVEFVADDFPLSTTSLENLIERSFLTWQTYAKTHSPFNSDEHVSKYEHAKDCNKALVRFRFGDSLIPGLDDGTNSLALARADKEIDGGHFLFKEGTVWVGSTYKTCDLVVCKSVVWTEPGLNAIVLHEIGHILGIGHIENTVMRSDIGNFIATMSEDTRGIPALKSIDHEAMLYPSLTSRPEIPGELFPYGGETDPQSKSDHKRMFLGDAPSKVVAAKFVFLRELVNPKGLKEFQFELRAGSRTFPIHTNPQVFSSTRGYGLFYQGFLLGKERSKNALARLSKVPASELHFGFIEVDSVQMPILILVNMSEGLYIPSHVSVVALAKDGLVTLFRSADATSFRLK